MDKPFRVNPRESKFRFRYLKLLYGINKSNMNLFPPPVPPLPNWLLRKEDVQGETSTFVKLLEEEVRKVLLKEEEGLKRKLRTDFKVRH